MSDHDIIIDSLTIRLPSGWQGDPGYLSRQISEQIQSQAVQLSSCQQMSISLKGCFAGNPQRAARSFSEQLSAQLRKDNVRKRGGYHD